MSKKADVELIKKLASEGKTVKQIAIETGYSEYTVRKWQKELDIKIKSTRTKLTQELLDEISKLVDEGLTNQEIADKFGMALSTVRGYIQNILNKETNSKRTKRITNKNFEFTQEQLEVIYGSLLGDMSMGINWKNARITINHGGDQEEYFDHKCEIFKDVLGKISKTPRYDKRTNKYYNRYAVRLLTHPIITEMYYKFYPNGIKTVSKEWLELLTPRSLAYWYMDDGSNSGVLATNGFSYEECLLIKEYFKNKWSLEVTIEHQKGKSGIQYVIYFTSNAKHAFYNLVKPYIIPSMEYKFKNWIP